MLNPLLIADVEQNTPGPSLDAIERLDTELQRRFAGKTAVHAALTRPLVSFQANKGRPVYRWYKYKEAFSAALVEYLLQKYRISAGTILDPNNGIARMVRGYFYEMACVIYECARVLKPGALLLMVNDNVRYAGANISVDMILSDCAEQLGFVVENILVLPGEKGNSSQQMGEHGRTPLRKCVYAWRKQPLSQISRQDSQDSQDFKVCGKL